MALDVWVAFVVASAVLLVIPGPTILLVVSYALGQGRATAWATVPGVALGDFVAMTASVLGAGAVLATSATLFTALKIVGAAYLIWLGIGMWRSTPRLDPSGLTAAAANVPARKLFWQSFVVTALNPKSIVFFVAFVPQFIDPARPVFAQFAILEATFVALAALNALAWALAAGQMRQTFRRPETLTVFNRTGGSLLIGAGAVTAALHK